MRGKAGRSDQETSSSKLECLIARREGSAPRPHRPHPMYTIMFYPPMVCFEQGNAPIEAATLDFVVFSFIFFISVWSFFDRLFGGCAGLLKAGLILFPADPTPGRFFPFIHAAAAPLRDAAGAFTHWCVAQLVPRPSRRIRVANGFFFKLGGGKRVRRRRFPPSGAPFFFTRGNGQPLRNTILLGVGVVHALSLRSILHFS